MARSFTAGSLVTLPRLTAISAARLAKQLLSAAAKEKKLPPMVAAARDAIVPVRQKLATELQKRTDGAGQETPVVRAADIVEDNAFGAFVDWLRALRRLPAERHPPSTTAGSVLDDAFKDGLEFLKIAPQDEWQEAEIRLAVLVDKGYREAVAKLGGKPFLDELDFAHEAYGKALGITEAKPVVESPAIRDALDDVKHELRAYVLAVSSQVKRKEPATQALADRLLAPLIHWKENAAAPLTEDDDLDPAQDPAAHPPAPKPVEQ